MAVNPTDYSYLYTFAPGTPTGAANELAETKRKNKADALQAALDAQEKSREADLNNQYNMGSLAERNNADTLTNRYQMGTLANDQATLAAKYPAATATVTPFATATNTQKTAAYPDERLDTYINSLRARLKTPDAVTTYLQNTNTLAPSFKKAVQDRLSYHITN